MKVTLNARLAEDTEDCLIRGACNRPFAHWAVNVDRHIGVLPPRKVVESFMGNVPASKSAPAHGIRDHKLKVGVTRPWRHR